MARRLGTKDTHDSRRLAALIESAPDAIIGKDMHGIVTSWNRGAEEMFGYRREEMIGASIRRIVPADRQQEEDRIQQAVNRGERVDPFETVRLAKDGRLVEVSIAVTPIQDAHGTVVGCYTIARDISAQLRREREAAQMSRLFNALSQINQAIFRVRSRNELLDKICRILVEHAGFTLAWIGWHEPETLRIVPLALSGADEDYVRSIRVYSDERPEGRGPVGTAFRSGAPYICNNVLEDPAMLPWREAQARHGLRAAAAFPIRENGRIGGALAVYSNRVGFFQKREIALLKEAARDIGFGLDDHAREHAARTSEIAVRRERQFTDAMMQSMPGILHVHDSNGRLLRWNLQFEQVSGYSADELARMDITDFFGEADKPQLTAKRAEVAAGVCAKLEAAFVTKDGRALPYYFTAQNAELDGTPGVVCIGIDVSARIEAQAAQRLSDERYRRLFECAPEGIVLADPVGVYLDANPAICKMLGYTRDELLGRSAADIAVPSQREHIAPALREINA
ncbi:MAG: PAS domain S-box protein, partial [Xanthomonadaceae bacterium]|nr:PAS domain S-box protein [Xanthomonadaceae bacterium]